MCKNHGYIQGEHFTCPQCGEKTEVYSRITGYYRPVQNWNDGKSQEYADRKVYNIFNSHLTHNGCLGEEKTEPAETANDNALSDGAYLFATATCPNCKIACATMDKLGVAYEKLYANERPDLARAYGIKQAPTLLVVKNGEPVKYTGVSEIKKYLKA